MKKDEMKGLIKPSNEGIEKKDKGVLRKTLIIGFIFISCVGLVYAGVKTLENEDTD